MNPGVERELTLLRRLARLHDIQTSYLDMKQRRIDATPEALRAGLQTLGAPVDQGNLAAAIEARRRDRWHWRLEPVLVAWEGELPSFTLRLPEHEARGSVSCSLRVESGETRQWQAQAWVRPCSRTLQSASPS